jgi:hypothetical protein
MKLEKLKYWCCSKDDYRIKPFGSAEPLKESRAHRAAVAWLLKVIAIMAYLCLARLQSTWPDDSVSSYVDWRIPTQYRNPQAANRASGSQYRTANNTTPTTKRCINAAGKRKQSLFKNLHGTFTAKLGSGCDMNLAIWWLKLMVAYAGWVNFNDSCQDFLNLVCIVKKPLYYLTLYSQLYFNRSPLLQTNIRGTPMLTTL